MPSFTVRIEKTLQFQVDIDVTASDEDAAAEKAEALCNDYDKITKALHDSKTDWELEDESYEVLEVSEN